MSDVRSRVLEVTVFAAGAVVMMYELVGSRVVAPYVGTSIFVWSSLIGVILGSLSLGYYLGGRLADRRQDWVVLAMIIVGAAFGVRLTALLRDFVPNIIQLFGGRVEWQSVGMALALFAPASLCLGMVSPYATRLSMTDVGHSGRTVGRLSALSTLGSIVGTFAAGFYLIPHVGSLHLLIALSIALLAVAALIPVGQVMPKKQRWYYWAGLSVLAIFFAWMNNSSIVKAVDIDTPYNRLWIYEAEDATGRMRRNLHTDPFGTQSSMFLDNPTELAAEYTKYYELANHFVPGLKNALMIGGCGYSYPKYFLQNYPSSTLDVVEIDPGMTQAARDYFGLADTKNLKITHADGRIFLNQSTQTYDAILIDAFNSFSSIPFHLTTREAVQQVSDRLNERGVVVLNLISALTGPKAKFFEAEYQTYASVFPQVYVLRVTDREPDELQNLILIAAKSTAPLEWESSDLNINQFLQRRWTGTPGRSVPILTDDFAPVDYYKLLSL